MIPNAKSQPMTFRRRFADPLPILAQTWETPRLCRGGTQSLPVPGFKWGNSLA